MSTINQPSVQDSDTTKESIPPSYKRKWLYWLGAVLVVVAIAFIAAYPKITEEIAYYRGIQAYVYGFPLVIMDVSNGVMTAVPKSGEYHAPINQFFRIRTYVSPDYKDVVRISRNSLWSVAVLDLDREPVVVFHPDTNGRFKVVQMVNMWTDNFGSVGSRTTGTGAGNLLVAGPKWNGTPPPDVKDVFRCRQKMVSCLT